MGNGTVTVRRAELADQEAVFAFIRQAYEGRWQYKIPERWAWLYLNNPFLEGPDLPVWVAVTERGEVVGQTCAMIEPVKIGGTRTRVSWSVDTFVLPAYRGQGLGYRLQEANDRANPLFMSMFMSSANRRIKEALGSITLDPVASMDRPMRHTPENVLAALGERLPLGRAARAPALGLIHRLGVDRAIGRAFTRRAARRDAAFVADLTGELEIEPVARFGQEADLLWDQLSPHFKAIVIRDQAYLNWKYVDQPHASYERFLARRNGHPCGHLILRPGRPPEPEVGVLADLFASPDDPDTLRGLVAYAIGWFRRAGVRYLIAGTSVQSYRAALEELGFRQRSELVPMAHCRLAPDVCQPIGEAGAWLLGRGDHDWDQYPNAR